jgi:hypothetical protein
VIAARDQKRLDACDFTYGWVLEADHATPCGTCLKYAKRAWVVVHGTCCDHSCLPKNCCSLKLRDPRFDQCDPGSCADETADLLDVPA